MLKQMLDRKVISAECREALINCLDPFHDTDVTFVGIPDGLPQPSIIRTPKKSLNIISPLADKTLPFDCHIFTLPERNYHSSGGATKFDSQASMAITGVLNCPDFATDAQMFVGPIVIVCVAAGQPTTPSDPAWPPAGSVTIQVVDYNDYYYGQSRETFSAFEVHNVTNKLNVGGTVTVYRMPQFNLEQLTSIYDVTTNAFKSGAMPSTTSRLPPGNLEQAMLLKGTRQWEAEFGAYCVETFDHEHNLPMASRIGNRIFIAGDFIGGDVINQVPCIAGVNSGLDLTHPYGITYKPVSKDTSGAYFTGLPGQTQLTLTQRKGIETFPTFLDPLVTLARNTPDHEPLFFDLYKRASQELPPGVPVGENASGDFWDSVLGVIADIAPVVGGAFGPAGAALGGLAGGAAKAGQAIRNKNQVTKKPVEKPDNTNFKVAQKAAKK
jgi:hypothetical protein